MAEIRSITPDDVERCVSFGLEAFRPVFTSFREYYGEELFNALRPDWETAQADYLREACSDTERDSWVAVEDGNGVGFVVLTTDDATGLGQIEVMAVDPAHQGRGVGTALTEHAVDRLRELGMTYAIVGTGGDPSHAPARQVYRNSGFEPMAIQPVHFAREL